MHSMHGPVMERAQWFQMQRRLAAGWHRTSVSSARFSRSSASQRAARSSAIAGSFAAKASDYQAAMSPWRDQWRDGSC